MPHHPIPKNATRISPSEIGQLLDLHDGLSKMYTTVKGTVIKRPQIEHGMYYGTDIYEVKAECPKCEDSITIHSNQPSGKHPIICHCDMSVVFAVEWSADESAPAQEAPPKKRWWE